MAVEQKALEILVRQLQELLRQISDMDYSQGLDLFDGASIGKHCRHIYDFLYTLALGLKTGILDYGHRERNSQLEQNPGQLLIALETQMARLKGSNLNQQLLIIPDLTAHPTQVEKKYLSTLERELHFVFYHTIHHMAMIKMGLKQLDCPIKVNPDFGLAPSTIAFQSSSQPS
jgi:uncharacterized damage-inducible protein DinB